jgi:putative Holliday junction resolvase
VRAVGLDLGARRIGVALSDSGGALATPYEVVVRGRDRARDHSRIAAIVDETGAEILVVGLPYSLDGSVGPAAAGVIAEVDELRAALTVEVVTHDERLTTVTAHRELQAAGVRGRKRRAIVDEVAAAVMLQAWLDGRMTPERRRAQDIAREDS